MTNNMRDLVFHYLNRGLSRRGFIRKMTAAGFTAVAANEVLSSLTPVSASKPDPLQNGNATAKPMQGTGGELLVEQLVAAGVEYLVVSNSSHLRNVLDAMVDHPKIHPILAVEEGVGVAIASGIAMASGKLGVAAMSVAGVPHSASNLYNATTAQLPVLLVSDMVPLEYEDREGMYGGRNLLGAGESNSKWRWVVGQTDLIPELTRRAIKMAYTAPGGPVMMTYPEDVLARDGVKGTIQPQEKFIVPTSIHASPAAIDRAARMLLESQSPAMYVGQEAWQSGARAACVELAELLGIPAMRVLIDSWVDTFPTDHPLFVNAEFTPTVRFPRSVDTLLVLGGFMPNPGKARVIQVTTAPNEISKVHPTEVPIFADTAQTVRDLITAIKSLATASRISTIAKPRIEAIKSFDKTMRESLQLVAKDHWNNKPIAWPRLALELDAVLDPDALIVDELSTEKTKLFSYLRTRDGGRTRIGRSTHQALGWGIGLSIGTKLVKPNQQVVSLIGDGAFLFGQSEALWSMSRYDIPVITIVMNNRSYNEPRQRVLGKMGKQGQTGKDMYCYLGSPDVDFARIASAFGIKGEVVTDPAQIKPALERAIKATRDGKPYLLDMVVERSGIGAESTWYPEFSLAQRRSRQV